MTFEEKLKDMMIESYSKVLGEEKWNSLSKEEKDQVLHLLLEGLCKKVGI